MPASPIRKLVPFATAAKERGIKVYHLNIGQPDIDTIPSAMDALRDIDMKVLEYSMSEGTPAYRAELARYYHTLGFTDLTPNNFIVTNGGSEALSFAIATLCDEGDEILVAEPYYANYNGFASTFGVSVVSVPSHINDGFSLPSLADMEAKISPKTKAILICNPNNPTGYVYTRDELQRLSEMAQRHNLVILSDEVYREYIYDGRQHVSMLSFPEIADRVVVVDSESKRYSMCGVRTGFMVSRSAEILSAAMKFAQARLSPALIGQILATRAHENDLAYIAAVREEYTRRRNLLVDELNAIPGVICPTPKGAFYCTVELPVDDAEKFAVWLLNEYQNNLETVMIAPAGGFYHDAELGKKQARLAYVLKEDDLKRCAEILRDALQVYNNRQD